MQDKWYFYLWKKEDHPESGTYSYVGLIPALIVIALLAGSISVFIWFIIQCIRFVMSA